MQTRGTVAIGLAAVLLVAGCGVRTDVGAEETTCRSARCGHAPCDVRTVVAKHYHTCARRTDGSTVCWGAFFGGIDNHLTPVPIYAETSHFEVVAFGGFRWCGLDACGQVACWGWTVDGDGQSALAFHHPDRPEGWLHDEATPVPIGGLDNAVGVAAGEEFACAVRLHGSVVCWGSNASGELGAGMPLLDASGLWTTSDAPVAAIGLDDVVEIAANGRFSCARRARGDVACWGGAGIDAGQEVGSTTPIAVPGIFDAVEITTGAHSCARRSHDGVVCWGNNSDGQLGDGTTTDKSTPVAVEGLEDAVQISGGGAHTCALRSNRSVVCWGDNAAGQLGDGTTTDRTTPVEVSGLCPAVEVSAGGMHTCARCADGSVRCWGDNWNGELGDGTRTNRTTPVEVSGGDHL
jgi:alpha-tubulin suppressor-like RCC1 family protein